MVTFISLTESVICAEFFPIKVGHGIIWPGCHQITELLRSLEVNLR